jgi:hypothetical protein
MFKFVQIAVTGAVPVNDVMVAGAIYALDADGGIWEKCPGCPWIEVPDRWANSQADAAGNAK